MGVYNSTIQGYIYIVENSIVEMTRVVKCFHVIRYFLSMKISQQTDFCKRERSRLDAFTGLIKRCGWMNVRACEAIVKMNLSVLKIVLFASFSLSSKYASNTARLLTQWKIAVINCVTNRCLFALLGCLVIRLISVLAIKA